MEAWRARQRVIKTLEEELSEEERREARQDHHARRPPRPCGITIHTGVGCPLACAYCYIYDMGFPGSAKPYKLSPLQLAYAVATNPHVAVGPWGTLVAVGSVTEPFLPQTRELALGYMKAIAAYLGNPLQVSTKMPPPPELAEVQGGLDVLISVTDLSGKLEPRAPPPLERLRAGAELIKRGISATLFVRPIVPGVLLEHSVPKPPGSATPETTCLLQACLGYSVLNPHVWRHAGDVQRPHVALRLRLVGPHHQ
jgi:DNA repair photolyase